MHLRLFLSRLSVLLKRSSWLLKIAISCVLVFSVSILWWFGLQGKIVAYKQTTVAQISDLSAQKIIFDQVLAEYQELSHKFASPSNSNRSSEDTINYCHKIVDQARFANLFLYSYVTKKSKDGYKQMTFNFFGSYQELLNFLINLDQANLATSCQRFKITASNHRLQIAYVCGIHTSVK